MTGETFGAMLKRLRTARTMVAHLQPGNASSRLVERELSQNELARQAGVNPAYVNRLEAGKPSRKDGRPQLPDRLVVLAFAEALGMSQAETDRLLYAAGLAPQADWQTRAEAAEAKLEMVRQTLDVESDLVIFRRRTG